MKWLIGVISIVVFMNFALAHNHSLAKKEEAVPQSVSHVYNVTHPASNHFTSGQPEQEDFKTFAQLGVDTVINFRSNSEMSDIPEAVWTTQAGQAYFHIPIAGSEDIDKESVALFNDVMQKVQDRGVLMHCASSNRVGAMMALRAAWHEGKSYEDAIQIGEQYGMTSLRSRVDELLKD